MQICVLNIQTWNKDPFKSTNESCINNVCTAGVLFLWLADFLFFTMVLLQIYSNTVVCWLEVHFQLVDWAWNRKGITLLFHSGLTWFTYNSLLIVLDHQLILCSQECRTVPLTKSVINSYCPQVQKECITSIIRNLNV